MATALKRLAREYKRILKEPSQYYSISPSEENTLRWEFIMFGQKDTIYNSGLFKGYILFPKSYPINAPTVYFYDIIHPNIHNDGKVCISILHEGVDQYGYESEAERWSPTLSVDSILMSIISMLSDPNFESPANINASVLWKNNKDEYIKKIKKLIAKSQQ